MDYNQLSNLVEKQFNKAAFESHFFEKEDLISDIYLFLAEQDKEFSELEILQILKKKYSSYFNIYDIEDRNSYDKFERPLESKDIDTISSQETFIYEYFEKIIWKEGNKCPKCQSKEVINQGKSYNCRNCGETYSFDKGTNLQRTDKQALRSLISVYTLLSDGIISLKDIQEKTNLPKKNIEHAFRTSLPKIVNDSPLIKKLEYLPVREAKNTKFKEYPHQTRTISEAVEYFKFNERGKIIHPCGSGKTYTATRVVQELNIDKLIVVIPSRILLYQQIEAFKKELPGHSFYAFGSLFTHDLKSKGIHIFSKNVKKQREAIKTIKKNKIVVFVTLKSFKDVAECFDPFDLAIFDEAHRIAGPEHKAYLGALYTNSYKKVLFLTATEKVMLKGGVGMDKEAFGETISNISLLEMIQAKVVLDYKLIHIGFKDEKIKKLVEENEAFFLECKIKLPVKTRILISALALIKSIEKYKLKKIITYHATIDEAVLFSEIFTKFQQEHDLNHNVYTINSYQSELVFDYNYQNFTNSECAVISSVDCFQEGMDVRDVDGILYGYPKKSRVDIVQSVGRCIRKYPGKKRGYVIIPSESEDYDTLIEILNALEISDNRIIEFKSDYKNSFKKNLEFLDDKFIPKEVFDKDRILKSLFIRGNKFVSYEKCKEWSRNNNILSQPHYRRVRKPEMFPQSPEHCYSEFEGWPKFLGTEKWNYFQSRDWMIKNNVKITSTKEWENYVKGNLKNYPPKPINIGAAPYTLYRKEWKGFKHFCGLEKEDSSQKKGNKLSYDAAREYLKKYKGILNITEYRKWARKKSEKIKEKFPNFLYHTPKENYDNFDWYDYLSMKKIEIIPYHEFIDFIKENNIKSSTQYEKFEKPKFVPYAPHKYYKEWVNWMTVVNSIDKKKLLKYEEAKKYLKSLKIKKYAGWVKYLKDPSFPEILLPRSPYIYYKDDWVSWEDFTSFKKPLKYNYEESKKYILELNKKTGFKISSQIKFQKWKKGDIIGIEVFPDFLERMPYLVFTDFTWEDFLSKDKIPFRTSGSNCTFWSFEESKTWLIKNGIRKATDFQRLNRNKKLPKQIPTRPDQTYKGKWKGWKDFLGLK